MVKKVLIAVTNGPDNPEKAVLPFIIANGAFATDAEEVVIMLQGAGVWLARRGVAEHVLCCKWKLGELLKTFFENNGKLLVCSPCLQEREIEEKDLIEEAVVAGAVEFLERASESDVVLVY